MCNSSFAYFRACCYGPTIACKIVAAFILFYCTRNQSLTVWWAQTTEQRVKIKCFQFSTSTCPAELDTCTVQLMRFYTCCIQLLYYALDKKRVTLCSTITLVILSEVFYIYFHSPRRQNTIKIQTQRLANRQTLQLIPHHTHSNQSINQSLLYAQRQNQK